MHDPERTPQENRQDPGELARAFSNCEFARLLGMELVDVWPGGARIVMNASGKRNLDGVAHGGAIFALADQAFGIAANCEGARKVAISAHIHYLAPAAGRLEAVAERVAGDGETSLYRVVVTEGSRIIAEFDGVGIRA
jgi:acyl-CoA thioesterase